MDLDSIWGSIKSGVENGMNDIIKVGVPALQNAGEQWAANVLRDQANQLDAGNKDTQARLNAAVSEVLARPDDESSFGHFLTQGLTGAGLNNYGLLVIGGIIGIGVIGYMVLKK